MRVAAVGDIHGHEYLAPFAKDLEGIDPPDLFLVAGDLTDRNDAGAFREVVDAIRSHVRCPVYGVFGNNEYADSHAAYRGMSDIVFLDDEAVDLRIGGRDVRLVGSVGSLDRPTWWQRNNMPGIAKVYDARVATIDGLLDAPGFRILLTHYPPTYATMGGEKDAWRPELGSTRLEAVVRMRRPDVVIHGHVHRGIPRATLGTGQRTLEDSGGAGSIPVYNVGYYVTHAITVLDL